MSYSNIIKLHKIEGKTVVGQNSREIESDNGYGRGSKKTAAGHQAITWASDPQDLLKMARAEAEAILSEASSKAEEVRLQAYEEGYQKGRTEGLGEAKVEALEHTTRIAVLAESVAADTAKIFAHAEEGIIRLSLAIAEKIVLKSLAEDRSLVVAMVKWALEQVDIVEVIRVRVNPEDYDIIRPYWENGQLGSAGKYELMQDSKVQVGGCIIDANKSVVDAQIGTKLGEIEQSFRSHLEACAR